MTVIDAAAVRKTIVVRASAAHAFAVFTEGIDRWWPRSHYIGGQPMEKCFVEPRVGGRLFERAADGSECDWGQVLVWDPPKRFVYAWQIGATWKYDPDLSKASEVEVLFVQQADGTTLVDLEHRHLERHGEGAAAMRAAIDSPGGWSQLLQLFADAVIS